MSPTEELQALVARHAGDGLTRVSDLAWVIASDAPTEPIVGCTEPALAVVVQGAKRMVLGDRVLDYAAGQYLVVSVELPVAAHISRATVDEPFLAFGIELRPERVASLLAEAGPPPPVEPPVAGVGVSVASDELLDAAARLLRLLDRPQDVAALAPAYEREVLWLLARGPQGAAVRQIGLADSSISRIGRTIAWIRAHYDEPLSVEALAAQAHMSVSTFHRHFRAATELTPLQFHKQVRLQEARARLLSQPDEVGGVAFAVGYRSPSQFSREYRRQFGVAPGQDAARRRRLVAG